MYDKTVVQQLEISKII
ncbi:ACD_00520 [African swine fever virus]